MSMFPPGRRYRRTGPFLNERGQGVAVLLAALAALLLFCIHGRGLW